MRVLGVIPARYASTRLPGKPLADICGKTLIQRVYERAALSKTLDRLVVATDDARILEAVHSFGGECLMTSPDHPNGTCRVAEASKHDDAEVVINIQGDEPLLDPVMIDEASRALLEDRGALSSTLCAPLDPESMADPNTVKVVTDLEGCALYFSRSPIPYRRVRTDINNFTEPYDTVSVSAGTSCPPTPPWRLRPSPRPNPSSNSGSWNTASK